MLVRTISSVILIAIVCGSIANGLRDELCALISIIMSTEILNIANLSNEQKPQYGNGELTKPTLLYYFLSMAMPINFYITIKGMSNFLLGRILIVVWTTDIFSYIIGSIVKGPKLNMYSPQKTWSGFIGGISMAILICFALKIHVLVPFAVQFGDIIESMVKRNVNIKDSNYYLTIPGHGGILDRIDGLLGAIILYQIIQIDYFNYSLSISI